MLTLTGKEVKRLLMLANGDSIVFLIGLVVLIRNNYIDSGDIVTIKKPFTELGAALHATYDLNTGIYSYPRPGTDLIKMWQSASDLPALWDAFNDAVSNVSLDEIALPVETSATDTYENESTLRMIASAGCILDVSLHVVPMVPVKSSVSDHLLHSQPMKRVRSGTTDE